jgi:hypothetical protein
MMSLYMLDRPISADNDRREFERMNLTMPVMITTLHENSQASNYLHHGITRDISYKGLGLVTSDPIRPGNVLLTLQPCRGEPFNVMAKVVYCNELGYYFQIGCEFLAK